MVRSAPRIFCFTLASAFLASAAPAAVTLEFDGIKGFVQEAIDAEPFGGVVATYHEKGFSIDVKSGIGVMEHIDGTLGMKDDVALGAGNLFHSVVIRHSSGLPFSFDHFRIRDVFSNFLAYYADVDKTLALQWPALEVTGTRRSGNIVKETISPWDGTIDNPTSLLDGFHLPPFGDTGGGSWSSASDPTLGDPVSVGPQFSGLEALEFRFLYPFDDSVDLACSPVNLGRAGGSCDASTPLVERGNRNDSGGIRFESITLSPVPLPAPALLLLSSLLLLGGSRALRAARAA